VVSSQDRIEIKAASQVGAPLSVQAASPAWRRVIREAVRCGAARLRSRLGANGERPGGSNPKSSEKGFSTGLTHGKLRNQSVLRGRSEECSRGITTAEAQTPATTGAGIAAARNKTDVGIRSA
jgi:hypothetical protein